MGAWVIFMSFQNSGSSLPVTVYAQVESRPKVQITSTRRKS